MREEVARIARRYFVMNSFDGILTVLGIVIGSYISGVQTPVIIIGAVIGAGIAMGISGISGAYLTEQAERTRKLKYLEKQLLIELKKTVHSRKIKHEAFVVAAVDGISPFLSAVVCLIPFFLSSFEMISIKEAYLSTIGISLFLLVLLGIFLGHISRENKIFYALKMLAVGLLTVFLIYLLGLGYF